MRFEKLVLTHEREGKGVPRFAVVRPPIGERESRFGFGATQVGGCSALASALEIEGGEVQVIDRAGWIAIHPRRIERDVSIVHRPFSGDVEVPGRHLGGGGPHRGGDTRNQRE